MAARRLLFCIVLAVALLLPAAGGAATTTASAGAELRGRPLELLKQAREHIQARRYAPARQVLLEALHLEPDSDYLWNAYGLCELELGNREAAGAAMRQLEGLRSPFFPPMRARYWPDAPPLPPPGAIASGARRLPRPPRPASGSRPLPPKGGKPGGKG